MSLSLSGSIVSKAHAERKSFNVFFSYDSSSTSSSSPLQAVYAIQKALRCKGYGIFEHDGSPFLRNLRVDENVTEELRKTKLFVVCISIQYRDNRASKALAEEARRLNIEMFFLTMQGDYFDSSPNKYEGWLAHLIQDRMCPHPGWNKAHLPGAIKTITGILGLKNRKIHYNDVVKADIERERLQSIELRARSRRSTRSTLTEGVFNRAYSRSPARSMSYSPSRSRCSSPGGRSLSRGRRVGSPAASISAVPEGDDMSLVTAASLVSFA